MKKKTLDKLIRRMNHYNKPLKPWVDLDGIILRHRNSWKLYHADTPLLTMLYDFDW